MPISLRLKYGVHTIFLLADPLAPFYEITTELFSILRDRHADGLRASQDEPPQPIPQNGADAHVSYGVLKDPHDESKGWKDLKIEGSENPASVGLKNNTMVAFIVRDADEADEAPRFVVQWPKLEEDEDEVEGEDEMDEDGMDDDEDDEL